MTDHNNSIKKEKSTESIIFLNNAYMPSNSASDCKTSNIQKEKKRRNRYSFEEKNRILKLLEIESPAAVSRKLKLSKKLLFKWRKKQSQITEAVEKKNGERRKDRCTISEELDDILYDWFIGNRNTGIAISSSMIKEEALRINTVLGAKTTFKASDGWLSGWKTRKGIRTLTIAGEQQLTDPIGTEYYEPEFVNCDMDIATDNFYDE